MMAKVVIDGQFKTYIPKPSILVVPRFPKLPRFLMRWERFRKYEPGGYYITLDKPPADGQQANIVYEIEF